MSAGNPIQAAMQKGGQAAQASQAGQGTYMGNLFKSDFAGGGSGMPQAPGAIPGQNYGGQGQLGQPEQSQQGSLEEYVKALMGESYGESNIPQGDSK